MITFGRKLKHLRQKNHLTQKELGIAMGFPETCADVRIAQYESDVRTPKEDLLKLFASTLGVPRKKIKKEQTHYQQALKNLLVQIKEHGETDELIAKKTELETELSNIDKSIKDIDYREANQKAGYVYVISNVGSFGENIYKIGMTRRLEPQDRVDELGDASVPFGFDVHAMIFSDNAPALEAALHRAFEDRKLNMVNTRREFFHVTLDEIKQVVKENFDKTVEFIDFPDAEQYRTSLKIREQLQA